MHLSRGHKLKATRKMGSKKKLHKNFNSTELKSTPLSSAWNRSYFKILFVRAILTLI